MKYRIFGSISLVTLALIGSVLSMFAAIYSPGAVEAIRFGLVGLMLGVMATNAIMAIGLAMVMSILRGLDELEE